jgi:uncharacterized protein
LLLARAAFAVEVPPLDGRVNDRAALLSPDARAGLERKLAEYEASSGHQFAVLTMPSLDGETLEAFSLRVVERWKLGRKGKDDGLLMVVVRNPHGIRMEIGYGLEGAVPDVLAGRIIRDVMAPAFRAGDFAGGMERAFDMLMTAASGGTPAEPPPHEAGGPSWQLLLALMFLLPFGAIVLVAGLTALFGRGRVSRGVGTRGGAVYTDLGGSSSGSSSGGGGSSSGGGGFSGGGGDFGGGGASGSW